MMNIKMEIVSLDDILKASVSREYFKKYIHNGNLELTLEYESNFSNTPKLRNCMEYIFDFYNLDSKDKNRLVLVSDELNNNAVEHGTGEGGYNTTKIIIIKGKDTVFINIEVADNGEGSAEYMEELKKQKSLTGFEKHNGIRGRGLFLITEKIADRLYFKDSSSGGLIVGIEKTL